MLGKVVNLVKRVNKELKRSDRLKTYLEENYANYQESKIMDLIDKDKNIVNNLKRDLVSLRMLFRANSIVVDREKEIAQQRLVDLYRDIYEQELSVKEALAVLTKKPLG